MPVLLAVVVLAAFGAAAWYALTPFATTPEQGEPPLIKAEIGPIKEKPAEPGGLKIPNQDKLVFERLTPAPEPESAVQLAPKPEEPVARPQPEPEAPAQAGADNGTPAGEEESRTLAAEPPPPPAPTAPAAQAAPAAPAPATAPAAGDTPAAEPEAERQVVAVAPAVTPPSGGEAFRIQLAAYRSEDTARRAWLRLRDEHKSVLGNLDARIARVEIEGKGVYYRLQAGPFADRADANQACTALKALKLGCFVVRS